MNSSLVEIDYVVVLNRMDDGGQWRRKSPNR